MRRWLSIALVIAMFSWLASPGWACKAPVSAITPPAHESCKGAAEIRGLAQVPQSGPCCKAEIRPVGNMLVTNQRQPAPVVRAVKVVLHTVTPCTFGLF